eukprot:EG_transcript_23594
MVDANGEEIRTIHIVGFPEDLKERELNLLFRKTPGFEGAFIKYGGAKVIAWANFTTQPLALEAIDDINGYPFDPYQEGVQLHASLAKTNTKLRSLPGGEDYRPKRRPDWGAEQAAPPKRPFLAPPPRPHYSRPPPEFVPSHDPVRYDLGGGSATTLYIKSSTAIDDVDLDRALQDCRGFVRMKMGRSGTSCFADFSDHRSASSACTRLQGRLLGGAPEGLVVEFARTSMK